MEAIWTHRIGLSNLGIFTEYIAIGSKLNNLNENTVYFKAPIDFTIKYWRGILDNAPGGSNQREFWFSIDGVQIEDTKLYYKGSAVDYFVTFTLNVNAGQTVSIKHQTNGPTGPAVSEWRYYIIYETASSNESILIGGTTSDTHISGRYYPVDSRYTDNVTELKVLSKIPAGFTAKKLNVIVNIAPGAGNSITLTVRKGSAGGTLSNTSLAVTLSNTDTSGADTSNIVSLIAGDKIDFVYTASGTPVNLYFITTIVLEAVTDGDFILTSYSTDDLPRPVNVTEYGPIHGTGGYGTESLNCYYVPFIIVKAMYTELTTYPTLGQYIITVRRNGYDTILTLVIDGTSGASAGISGNVNFVDRDIIANEYTLSGIQIGSLYCVTGILCTRVSTLPTVHIKGGSILGKVHIK